jgi:hypothetical protein
VSELAKIETEYTAKIKQLQSTCPHKRLSEWQPLYWAPGHATRYEVKICRRCGKIVKKRTWCDNCSKRIRPEKEIKGDGDVTPINAIFCSEKCKKEYPKKFK